MVAGAQMGDLDILLGWVARKYILLSSEANRCPRVFTAPVVLNGDVGSMEAKGM